MQCILYCTVQSVTRPRPARFPSSAAESILYGVMESQLTVEVDRPSAVTQVARSILQKLGAGDPSPTDVIDASWAALHGQMVDETYTIIVSNAVSAPVKPGAAAFAFGSMKLGGAMVSIKGDQASYQTEGGKSATVSMDGLLTTMGVELADGALTHLQSGLVVELCACGQTSTENGERLCFLIALTTGCATGDRRALGLAAGTMAGIGLTDTPAVEVRFY